MNGKCKLGRKYIFTETGLTYSMYKDFIRENCIDYLPNFKSRDLPDKVTPHRLVKIGSHEFNNNILLGLFQNVKTKQVYVYGINGGNSLKELQNFQSSKHYKIF